MEAGGATSLYLIQKIQKLEERIQALESQIVTMETEKFNATAIPIKNLPSKSERKSFLFSIPNEENNTGLRPYSKGIYVTNGGNDASVIAVDNNTKLQFCYRANGIWREVREL